MSDVSSSGQPPPSTEAASRPSYARQLWLGAVPVLVLALVIGVGYSGWQAWQSRSAKARDRQICLQLESLYRQLQNARETPSPDFGPIRARVEVIRTSIPEALDGDTRPGFLARQLLASAARHDLPRVAQDDLSTISESEVEFVRKLIQAAVWLDLPTPAFRLQPERTTEALAEIEDLGGVVSTDPSRPVQPVTAIEMKGDRFHDRHLKHLPNITSLTIESPEITDAGLQILTRIRSLMTVRLNCGEITDAGIARLATLPALEEIQLSDCLRVTDNGLLPLREVRRMTLVGDHITDRTLAVLPDFSDLEHLTLQSNALSDEGIGQVVNLPGLKMLNLSHCHALSDEGLARLAEHPGLRTLRLAGVDLTDDGLEALGTLPSLRWLMISHCDRTMPDGLRITDAGLAGMENLAGFEGLSLDSAAGVTDAGVTLLQGISSLSRLDLYETGITEAGRLQIVASHPQCRLNIVLTPPSPLEDAQAAGAEGDASQDSAVASSRAWPAPDARANPDGKVTIEELEAAYRAGREATDTKYAGKWIELSGPVSYVGDNLDGNPVITLRGSDRRFDIVCVLRSAGDQRDVMKGETCHLRGVYCASVVPTFIHCTVNGTPEGSRTDATGEAAATGDANRLPPDVTFTAEELDAVVAADSRLAQEKYAGKRVQITGPLSRISQVMSGAVSYRLGDPLGTQCYLRTGNPWCAVRPGQTVTLIGRWFRSYPCLVDCEVTQVAGAGSRTMTSTALGEYFEADAVHFRKWFSGKQFIVTGEVIEKAAAAGYPDQISITLRSTPGTKVVCKMEIDELRGTESVQVGDTVAILGRNTREAPKQSVVLDDCLFWRGK